mmetsp:Transcript_9408/g.33232  ORF Transcript_9408/g.33232 Transcript_9408/m.33232 type:complete len:93 (+) Transcript_9408:611-889(+)
MIKLFLKHRVPWSGGIIVDIENIIDPENNINFGLARWTQPTLIFRKPFQTHCRYNAFLVVGSLTISIADDDVIPWTGVPTSAEGTANFFDIY